MFGLSLESVVTPTHSLTYSDFSYASNSQSPQNDNPKKQHACPLSQIPLSLSLFITFRPKPFFFPFLPFQFLSLFLSPYSVFVFYLMSPFLYQQAGAAAAAAAGDCVQATGNGNGNQTPPSTSNDSIAMTEHQVAKLMEEDMGSAMQYLQGKGLCLMPISLATAISTATCHSRSPLINTSGNQKGPLSPSMSVLTVQSATAGNGAADSSVKEVASVSKP